VLALANYPNHKKLTNIVQTKNSIEMWQKISFNFFSPEKHGICNRMFPLLFFLVATLQKLAKKTQTLVLLKMI
jgi:hypothetical protein